MQMHDFYPVFQGPVSQGASVVRVGYFAYGQRGGVAAYDGGRKGKFGIQDLPCARVPL